MLKLGVSTVAFKNTKEIRDFYEKTGIPLEYGVNLKSDDVKLLLDAHVKCTSVHVPSPTQRFFPNFASGKKEVLASSMDILKQSMDTLSRCGGTTLVIHPGYAIDALVPSDYEKRKPFIEKGISEFEEYIIDRDGAVTGPSYLQSYFYKRYFENFKENISLINDLVESYGFYLAIENLNPRLYYILQLPSEILELSGISNNIHFCLDFGHLFISSIVNKFDFMEGIRNILATDKVIHFHLSNNPSRPGYYNDAHDHITSGNIDYTVIIPQLTQRDATLILEIKHNPTEDIAFLKDQGVKWRYLEERE